MPVANHYNPKIYMDFETTAAKFNSDKYDNWGIAWARGDVIQIPQVNQWGAYVETKYEKAIKKSKLFKIQYEKEWLFIYGIGINSALEFLVNLKHNFHIYFHNGGKFDFHFILEGLRDYGISFVPNYNNYNILKNNGEIVKEWDERLQLLEKELQKQITPYYWDRLYPGEAKILADGAKNIYSIEYVPLKKNYKTGKDIKITLKDSYKLFNNSLEKLGEVLNDTFETKLYTKLDSDYTRENLYTSLQEFENDTKEFEYLKRDCLILKDFFLNFYKIYPEKYIKLTSSSTSYNHWIRTFGENAFNEWIKDKDNIKKHKKGFELYRSPYKKNNWKTKFNWTKEYMKKHFPTDWLNENKETDFTNARYIHEEYYNGGISWVNEKYRGVELPNIDTYDINSSYPSVMNSNALLPYGAPIKSTKIDFSLYQLFKIKIKKDLTTLNGIPFLINQISNKSKQYLRTIKKDSILYIDTFEYQAFLKYYKPTKKDYSCRIEYSFNTKRANEIYGEFVDYWYTQKLEAKTEMMRNLSKLMLNSVYGKNGTKTLRDNKEWNSYENKWLSTTIENKASHYIPLAVAITSLARVKIIEGISDNVNNVAYVDTDSIHWINDKPFPNEISKTKLGAWKKENKNTFRGVYRRPKQYFLKDNINPENNKLVYAGINFKKLKEFKQIDFIDFVYGITIPEQLRSYRQTGFVALMPIEKEIKPIWDYPKHPEQVFFKKEHYDKLWLDQ